MLFAHHDDPFVHAFLAGNFKIEPKLHRQTVCGIKSQIARARCAYVEIKPCKAIAISIRSDFKVCWKSRSF